MVMKDGIEISMATVGKIPSPAPTQVQAATRAGRLAETVNRDDVPPLFLR